jgi:Tol biopolymer transport system component
MLRRSALLAVVALAVAPAAAGAQRIAYAEETFDAPSIPQLRTLEPPAASGTPDACCGTGTAPDWSRDSRRVAFSRPAGDAPGPADLWTIAGDLTGAVDLTSTPAVDEREPSWSPDGRRIAYVSDGTVFVLDLATGDSLRLGRGGEPAWSPVDDRLLVVRAGAIVLTRAVPGATATVLSASGSAPEWSPDGRAVAFARYPARRGIWRMRADGSHARRLSRGIDSHPAWSPDGRRIAFSRATPEGLFPDHLWTMGARGGRERPIRVGGEPVLGVTPDWG